ncbi:hypothetical protein D7X12_03125 [Corallococcus sicarius]|uniref:Uncharacterized protein n=1 Tax=Corallococcus sicarius TaxID=2316726 RepID=A0A3A8NV45_9BACT|nr:hypothetical protein D7X12_03125 [Corallococcus sicarius]
MSGSASAWGAGAFTSCAGFAATGAANGGVDSPVSRFWARGLVPAENSSRLKSWTWGFFACSWAAFAAAARAAASAAAFAAAARAAASAAARAAAAAAAAAADAPPSMGLDMGALLAFRSRERLQGFSTFRGKCC